MRPRTLTALAAVGLAVAAPVALAGQQSTTIGTGAKTCVLKPGADCRGVVHRWSVEHHGNLRKAKFTKADLRGADLRGADLRGADFRGAKLRHADLRGAKLNRARFEPVKRAGKVANSCDSNANCEGTDLSYSNLSFAVITNANLSHATIEYSQANNATFTSSNFSSGNLSNSEFTSAYFVNANMSDVDLYSADLSWANLTNANFKGTGAGGVTWYNTTCPNGTGSGTTYDSVSGPPCSPGAPTGLVVQDGIAGTAPSIAFTAGDDNGSPMTNYEWSTNNGSTWTARSPASSASPITITGLSPGTYKVMLRAVNSLSVSAASEEISVTYSSAPGPTPY
jgi:uncharacterized protein YjbI with pentapeptide repeats